MYINLCMHACWARCHFELHPPLQTFSLVLGPHIQMHTCSFLSKEEWRLAWGEWEWAEDEEGVRRGVGPGISFCDSSALLLQLRDAFWVLAAGRGAGCQTEDGDKERLEEEGRDHIYFHHHLYLITCSCFVLSLISSSPGCLQPSGMQKHTAHTHVCLYICTRLLSYLNIQIHGRC